MFAKLFKTRREVQALRKDVESLSDMLKVHFDIKYTLADFAMWRERHPDAKHVPVTEGEWLRFGDMLAHVGSAPTKAVANQHFSYRDMAVVPVREYTQQ
jgi:hypothetical protein